MNKILDLAQNTFRETIRDRVLNVALVFAVALIGASVLLGQLSIGQDLKIVRDLGLASIEVFAAAIAIFIGTSLLHRELDKRTIFVVLAKPVTRWQFLIGKFVGLSATMTALLGAMTLAYVVLLVVMKAFSLALLWQVALVWVQVVLIVALAVMFSTFASPVMAMVFTFGLYLIGHNLEGLKLLGAKASPAMKALADGLYFVLPNLGHLDIKNQVVYGAAFSSGQWLTAFLYGGLYMAVALCVAMAVFSRREM